MRHFPGKCRLAIFLLLLAASLSHVPACMGAEVFSASCPRPFPTLMPLDYSSCRAQAWLAALQKASPALPAYVSGRLRELGLDQRLGKLALCALAFPVEVTTPDISASTVITVYIRSRENFEDVIANILKNPSGLMFEMCLLAEVECNIKALHDIWPANLPQARERLGELEACSQTLNALWKAVELNSTGQWKDVGQISSMASMAPRSAAIYLALSTALLDAGRPQKALEAASTAIKNAGAHMENSEDNIVWPILLARALYTRGMSHWRLDQLALAETDFDRAEDNLNGLGNNYALLPRVFLARGALRGLRRNTEGMCEDYEKACVMGKCEGMASARGQGLCLGKN